MPASSTSKTTLIQFAQAIFLLNAIIWVVFILLSLGKIGSNQEIPSWLHWIILFLMLGNAGAMLVSALLLEKRRKLFFVIAVIVVTVNILLTFTDQVGVFDWITLCIDIILLILLVAARREYF